MTSEHDDAKRQAGEVGSSDQLGPLVTEDQLHDLLADFGWTEEGIGAYTSRKQVAFARRVVKLAREACIKACASEQLQEEPETEGDLAYFQAVQDCIAAIRRAYVGAKPTKEAARHDRSEQT